MRYYNDEEFDYGPALEYIEAVNGDIDFDYAMESLGEFEPVDEFDVVLESLALEGMDAYHDNDYDRLYAVLEELDEAQDVADEDDKKLRRKQRLKKAAKIGAGLVASAVALGAGNKLRKHLKGKKNVQSVSSGQLYLQQPKQAPGSPAPKQAPGSPAPKQAPGSPAPKQALGLPAPKQALGLPAPKQAPGLPAPKQALGLPAPKQAPVKTAELVPEKPHGQKRSVKERERKKQEYQAKQSSRPDDASQVVRPKPIDVKYPSSETERRLEIASANGGTYKEPPKVDPTEASLNREGRRALRNDADKASGPKKQRASGKRKKSNRDKAGEIEAAKRAKNGELSNFEKKQGAAKQDIETPKRRPGSYMLNSAGIGPGSYGGPDMSGSAKKPEEEKPTGNRAERRAKKK